MAQVTPPVSPAKPSEPEPVPSPQVACEIFADSGYKEFFEQAGPPSPIVPPGPTSAEIGKQLDCGLVILGALNQLQTWMLTEYPKFNEDPPSKILPLLWTH
ncbi:MAG: hypothetical protein HYV03_05045 [Deltaproteobacteria bacterium]|nr:hypothetical protein [Deltaproteobacteria bacterium]